MSSGAQAGGRTVYDARIERIFEHAPDTRSLFLRIVGAASFSFTPGQFISVEIPLGTETRVRPYSLASSPEDGQPLEICFNLVPGGVASHYLFGLKVGERLSFTGPFGTFTLDRTPEVETVFVAETTAIAPVRPMVRRALARGPHPLITLVYAAPSPSGLLYLSEFREWARKDPLFRFEPLILVPVSGGAGFAESLRQRIEDLYVKAAADRTRRFYVCGIGKGVLALRDLLRGAGYQRRAVQYEQW